VRTGNGVQYEFMGKTAIMLTSTLSNMLVTQNNVDW